MFYPDSKDSGELLRFANSMVSLAGSPDGKAFVDSVKRERAKLHSQMEVATPDLIHMMQGTAQAYTRIVKLFDDAPSTKAKLLKKRK
ncbi:MAG: hypothetical protein BA863_07820 [Desulfovibrio sp. S3730MH75]|nr:MAG: hypothetical protein BA863_07820 [Desulfovibrio sp. S3730MH75]